MQIQRVPLALLKFWPQNARKHGPVNHAAIKGSLVKFGQAEPLVVQASTQQVVGGNGRLAAMRELGWTECDIVLLDLDDTKAAALGLALNRTSELASWDEPVLAEILQQLDAAGELGATGFSHDDLGELLDRVQSLTDDGDLDVVPEPPEQATTRPGDLWVLGDHRLLCGDSASPADLDRLLAGAPIHLVNTDPPYNVKVEPRSNNAIAAGLSSFTTTHHQKLDVERHPDKAQPTTRRLRAKDRPLQNDFMTDEAFAEILGKWFGNLGRVLLPGRGFYLWGGYSNVANYPPAMKAAGLYFSQAVIWVKEHPVLTRKDFMGDHEWCQPAGTMVQTPDGEVSIESLKDGDRVVSFSRHHNQMIGVRSGESVACTNRPYRGDLIGVHVGRLTTWTTPGHLWTARLADHADGMWCVYLMKRGDWWRVGKSRLITTWGFGLKQRLYTEGGEQAWILSIHSSSLEAALTEQIALAKYGIPLTTWAESQSARRTIKDVSMLYERLDLSTMRAGALQALADHGRHLEFPLLSCERDHCKVSRRVSTTVRTCNLLPGVMVIPTPARGVQVRWDAIASIERHPFDGPVYSMNVEKFGHYVADGIVTHNCFYGWKEGAAHEFFGPNNATDVWSVKKVNPQSMVHLTEKPTELASRALLYSSRRGENVLDLFGGSGSTLVSCEQHERHAFLMELDELYCDVILTRWAKLTGKQPTLEASGETFEVVKAERTVAGRAAPSTA